MAGANIGKLNGAVTAEHRCTHKEGILKQNTDVTAMSTTCAIPHPLQQYRSRNISALEQHCQPPSTTTQQGDKDQEANAMDRNLVA